MYTIKYLKAIPTGYTIDTFKYNSFVAAITIYKTLIAQREPYTDVIIHRDGNPKSMGYVDKIIPF